jgi:hypothetical protein
MVMAVLCGPDGKVCIVPVRRSGDPAPRRPAATRASRVRALRRFDGFDMIRSLVKTIADSGDCGGFIEACLNGTLQKRMS